MCIIQKSANPTGVGVWWQDDTEWCWYGQHHENLIRKGVHNKLTSIDLGVITSGVHPQGQRYVVDLEKMEQVAVGSGQRRPVMIVDAAPAPRSQVQISGPPQLAFGGGLSRSSGVVKVHYRDSNGQLKEYDMDVASALLQHALVQQRSVVLPGKTALTLASCALILFLLLTSFFSHVHDTEQQELLHKSGAADELSDNSMPDRTAGQTRPHFVDSDGFGFDDSGRSGGNLYSKNDASSQQESLASDGSSDQAQRLASQGPLRKIVKFIGHCVILSFILYVSRKSSNVVPVSKMARERVNRIFRQAPLRWDRQIWKQKSLNFRQMRTFRSWSLAIPVVKKQDLISSETTSYVDAFDDSKNLEDSPLLVYPLTESEADRILRDLEDVFADELQSMITQMMKLSRLLPTSHGAKVLGANKEAKGAGHIINSDKDKYHRNPCGAEDKFVVLELSEETFVDTVWILLGQFRAENVRHRQKFTIDDPKLVRYLMLKMLTHWGYEFLCTPSSVEVFGVDVIKNLLDDWIASEESESAARVQTTTPVYHAEEAPAETQGGSVASADGAVSEFPSLQASAEVNMISQDAVATVNGEKKVDTKEEDLKAGRSGQPELHHIPGGKPPGDSVLKILMQRVKALELNQSLFDNYLEDTNVKYKAMLSELDKDLAVMSERLRNATAMSALLAMRLLKMESKQKEEKVYLENQLALISSNFTENVEFMRWQIQSMERCELTAIILAFCSPVLASLLLLLARCLPNRRSFPSEKQTETDADTKNLQLDSCRLSSSVILYLSCGLIILILSV
ncbi:hypothetical protein R1sor_007477 [Riccia sorocarpa]|uniref:SUN domain-containing protein n=1 Tax=Riccia sorocarpa TaxID=122646 RepID=A0ABD3HSA6_9MARC